ncbi:ribosome recycling factor family protein [Vibrio zhugei]|nr:ribosome recycling factor family protein [Vibrio zhugei]
MTGSGDRNKPKQAIAITEIRKYCRAPNQPVHPFMIQRMQDTLVKLSNPGPTDQSEALKQLVRENRAITLADLMAQTDCTLSEARTARYAVEDEWL